MGVRCQWHPFAGITFQHGKAPNTGKGQILCRKNGDISIHESLCNLRLKRLIPSTLNRCQHAKTRSYRHNLITLWGFFPRLYPSGVGLIMKPIFDHRTIIGYAKSSKQAQKIIVGLYQSIPRGWKVSVVERDTSIIDLPSGFIFSIHP